MLFAYVKDEFIADPKFGYLIYFELQIYLLYIYSRWLPTHFY